MRKKKAEMQKKDAKKAGGVCKNFQKNIYI